MLKSAVVLLAVLTSALAFANTEEDCKRNNAELLGRLAAVKAQVSGEDAVLSLNCVKMGDNYVGKVEKNKLDTLTLAQLKQMRGGVKDCPKIHSADKGGRALASSGGSTCEQVNAFVTHVLDKAASDIDMVKDDCGKGEREKAPQNTYDAPIVKTAGKNKWYGGSPSRIPEIEVAVRCIDQFGSQVYFGRITCKECKGANSNNNCK